MEETTRAEARADAWSGTYTDLKALIDHTVASVQEISGAAEADVSINIYWANRDIDMTGTERLVEALQHGRAERFRSLSVWTGHSREGVRVRMSISRDSPAIHAEVFGTSKAGVRAIAADIQTELEQGARWWGWGVVAAICAVGFTGCLCGAMLIALAGADSSLVIPLFGIAVVSGVLGLIALGGFLGGFPALGLRPDGEQPWWPRWKPRIAAGLWAIALLVLGAAINEYLF